MVSYSPLKKNQKPTSLVSLRFSAYYCLCPTHEWCLLAVEASNDNLFLEDNFGSKYSFDDDYHFWFSDRIFTIVLKENK